MRVRYASRDGLRRIRLRQKVRSTSQTPAVPIGGGAEDTEADSKSSCKCSPMVSRRAGSKNGFEFMVAPPPPRHGGLCGGRSRSRSASPRGRALRHWRPVAASPTKLAGNSPPNRAIPRHVDHAGPPWSERHETRMLIPSIPLYDTYHIVWNGTIRQGGCQGDEGLPGHAGDGSSRRAMYYMITIMGRSADAVA